MRRTGSVRLHRLVFALLLLLILLAAPVVEAKVTLTWFANIVGGAEMLKYYEQVAAEFNRTHKDIEVTLMPMAGGYYEKIPVMVAAGTPFDLCFNQSPTPQAQGYFLDLTPYLERDKSFRLAEYQAIAVDYGRIKGKPGFFTMPNHLSTHGFYYNIDMFQQAGLATPDTMVKNGTWTWDNFSKISRKMTVTGADGKVTRGFARGLFTEAYMSTFGAKFIDVEGVTEKSTVRSSQMLTALENYATLHSEQVFNGGTFAEGKSVLEAEWNDRWFKYQPLSFEVDAVRYPKGTTPNVMVSGGGWAIPITTKHPEAAWELMKFVVSEYGLRAWATLQAGTIPAHVRLAVNMWRDESWGPKHKREAFLDAVLENGVIHERKYAPSWNTVFSAVGTVLADLRAGKTSASAAAENMDRIIINILNPK